jgi:hypothetical protein
MITDEQKIKFADYILNWLTKEKLLREDSTSIDQEQLEETCMAGYTICQALVESDVIDDIGY